ncbi:MAG: FAD-dependent oxidoreductase [Actinomycetota bacterium]
MHRRTFLSLCAALGVAGPLAACATDDAGDDEASDSDAADDQTSDSPGRVLIVGAGAAGLSVGHLLAQRGIDFEIIEAAPTYGGRIKRADGFVDFPIPLGGEWLHEPEDELNAIVDDPDVEVTTEMRAYNPADPAGYYDGQLVIGELGDELDLKFVGATWLDFFDEYIVPSVADHMTFDTEIVEIEYGDDGVVLTAADGTAFTGDRVVVTVPLTALQNGRIAFDPPLPDAKLEALDGADVWGGIKVFVEFAEAFYPTALAFPDSETADGQRLYYDAAYGQNSTANVLGLFAVGAQAEPYQQVQGDGLRDLILAELDEIFDGAASQHYVQHIAQNWNEEPFVEQAYLADVADGSIPSVLWEPVGERLFFAGDAYTTHDDWSAVDDAAQSARDTVERIVDGA